MELFKVICPNNDYVVLHKAYVSKQNNSFDCGLYALAFSVMIAYGLDPKDYELNPNLLRKHYKHCINSKNVELFPAVLKRNLRERTLPTTCLRLK